MSDFILHEGGNYIITEDGAYIKLDGGASGLTEITTGIFSKLSGSETLIGSGLKDITIGLFTEKFLG